MKSNAKCATGLFALVTLFSSGCGVSETSDMQVPISNSNEEGSTGAESGQSAGGSSEEAGSIVLSPANTTIQFVGNHTGEDKKPRTCTFASFTGSLAGEGELTGLNVEIKTDSLETEFADLTTHLKNAEFFDVKRYPSAKFVATSVEAGDGGMVNVTGDLTLLGQTHSLAFPAKFSPESDPVLTASFEIDRTKWGMNYGPDKIEKMVEMTITVSK